MSEIVFESLAFGNKHGYTFSNDSYDKYAEVDSQLRMFDNYGDKQVQHSRTRSITLDVFADYLFSLAAAALTDDKLANEASYLIRRGPGVEQFAFAASIVFKESDKSWTTRRYYSLADSKISKSQSKQYDKRYQEIPSWADGTPESIYRLLISEFASPLKRYTLATQIREWALTQPKMYMQLPAEFLDWFLGDDENRRRKSLELRDALDAAMSSLESYRLREHTKNNIESHRLDVERRERKAKEELDAKAAAAEAASDIVTEETTREV